MRYSATSLQDYVDCPRRYQLRYVLDLPWPALETATPDDQEERARLGRDLHRLIHQHLIGLPPETLSASLHGPLLAGWWRDYLAFAPPWRERKAVPEVTLSVPISGQRLVARYDALAWLREMEPDQTAGVILEWKTFRRRPTRAWLARRLQSHVYPYVLVAAGGGSGGRWPIAPETVEMYYWLAGPPAQVERFAYSQSAWCADTSYLEGLITEISDRIERSARAEDADSSWDLTGERQMCRHCVYRSLCGRGVTAGASAEQPEDDVGADESLAAGSVAESSWAQVQETVY